VLWPDSEKAGIEGLIGIAKLELKMGKEIRMVIPEIGDPHPAELSPLDIRRKLLGATWFSPPLEARLKLRPAFKDG